MSWLRLFLGWYRRRSNCGHWQFVREETIEDCLVRVRRNPRDIGPRAIVVTRTVLRWKHAK